MSDLLDDASIDIEPRIVGEIVGRASVLSALTHRGLLEVETDRDAYELETDRFDLAAWARSDLQSWVEEQEMQVLDMPVGELAADDLALCEDALACLSTIAWTFGALELDALPLTLTAEETDLVLRWAPTAWSNLSQMERQSSIRSEESLAAERERWELWHWRAVEVVDAGEEMADVLEEIRASGVIPMAGNDLATLDGIPFHELGEDDREEIAWLAGQRLHTLNWVCGFGGSWTDVPLYPD
jgi:hypothetical protein